MFTTKKYETLYNYNGEKLTFMFLPQHVFGPGGRTDGPQKKNLFREGQLRQGALAYHRIIKREHSCVSHLLSADKEL